MEKLLYFDPFNGVSGDMILAALIDLGLPLSHLEVELKKLGLEGYQLSAEPIQRQGLFGTNFEVRLTGNSGFSDRHHSSGQDPGHQHHEASRGLTDIRHLIEDSALAIRVKERALRIFERLGEAEARVHRKPVEKVHFHEVGALDAIIDIVGACIGFEYFKIRNFFTAPLWLGSGTVSFSHGTWPVPAPATAELIVGFPARMGPVEGELSTPTGAAVVTTLVDPHQQLPPTNFLGSGLGAGDREFDSIPNMLRLMLGQPVGMSSEGRSKPDPVDINADSHRETVDILKASLDDSDGEMLGFFVERALSEGALDVYYASLNMKKGRPGVELTLLCRPQDRDRMIELIFKETTTLGIRVSRQDRLVADCQICQVKTDFGPIRVKLGRFRGKLVNIWPEYEDLKKISQERGVALKVLRAKVWESLGKLEL